MTLAERERAFWCDGPGRAARLAFRVAFFAVLSLDGWLDVAHAARYGAGGFNVSHLPWLDGLLPPPSRAVVLALCLVQAVLALRVALGGAGRATLVALTCAFAARYLSSQLDSYQHHYLVLVLLVALAVRPGRLDDDGPAWPFRLVLGQLSIVYAWAAVAKLDPSWRGGDVLAQQVHVPWVRSAIEMVGGFAVAAAIVIALELFLAVAIHLRRLRPVAAPLGIGFHLGLELADFHIGLFSYFMAALYLLVVPDAWMSAAGRWLGRRTAPLARATARAGAWLERRTIRGSVKLLVLGPALLLLLPFREVHVAVAAVALVALAVSMRRHRDRARRVALINLLACAIVAAYPVIDDAAVDHYRFLGGSSRRLGRLDESVAAYRRVADLAPDDPRGFIGLARAHEQRGDRAAAIEAAVQAMERDPDNQTARAIFDRARGAGP